MTDQFEWLAFEAGLPPIRPHDLRHGAATLHLAAGVEMKIVQAMLRHASVSTTSDIYTSVLLARYWCSHIVSTLARTAERALFGNEERPVQRGCESAPSGT
ncbi:tyrosine-type recombinase/integrase [Spirillospora sp. NBC_00431]